MEIIRNAIMPGAIPAGKHEWPFKDMNAGDAVKIPDHLKARARSAVTSYAQYSGKKFVVRTVAGELMVYRVA